MKRNLLSIFFIVISSFVFGQLNTKTKTSEDGAKTISTYHKNGKPSVIESWDKDQRWGSMKAFNSDGKELFNYDLRKFSGHATVYLEYYPNGQVKKAEYSSMPDAGIQWYRYIHEFDESGNQTYFANLSMNTGTEILVWPDSIEIPKTIIVTRPNEVVECAVIMVTNYQVVNETDKTITVTMKAVPNKYIAFSDTTIILFPNQTFQFKSSYMAQIFLPQDVYDVKEIKGKRKKEKYKFLVAQPTEDKNLKTYSWHILKSK